MTQDQTSEPQSAATPNPKLTLFSLSRSRRAAEGFYGDGFVTFSDEYFSTRMKDFILSGVLVRVSGPLHITSGERLVIADPQGGNAFAEYKATSDISVRAGKKAVLFVNAMEQTCALVNVLKAEPCEFVDAQASGPGVVDPPKAAKAVDSESPTTAAPAPQIVAFKVEALKPVELTLNQFSVIEGWEVPQAAEGAAVSGFILRFKGPLAFEADREIQVANGKEEAQKFTFCKPVTLKDGESTVVFCASGKAFPLKALAKEVRDKMTKAVPAE